MEQKNGFKALDKSLYWTGGLYLLTAFHHYYGSVVYGTPWRAHVVLLGGMTFLLCLLLAWQYRRSGKKLWLYSYLIIAVLMFGTGIGLFEGLYNHVVKNLLYFAGMNRDSWRIMFPAPAYEVPENFLFEASGVLQFVVGIGQIRSVYKTYQSFKK
ncbi:hypothetical protein [Taibaiella soli]|uniref:Uncharacterized protein n=1 Tax=Taibaiella soli TaxID=1649169 RepID=A0A2W2BGP0_9BACT|nr:hypothetical protein [Taibaiella soli]PZF72646.1 hypothetical protein DN068_12330 [Taibaiella soli]